MVAIVGKKASSFEVLHFPRTCVCSGGGGVREGTHLHIFYCEMFIIGRNLTIFPVWL